MKTLERLRSATLWAALTLGFLAFMAVVTSFLPGAPYVPEGVVMTLFVLVFPVYGAAFVREMVPLTRLRRGQPRRRARLSIGFSGRDEFRQLIAPIPVRVRTPLGVFFFAMWLTMMITIFTGAAGQPTARDGRYFLNNHGQETEISLDEYDRAVSQRTRAFAAGAAVFYAMAATASRYGPLINEQDGDDTAST